MDRSYEDPMFLGNRLRALRMAYGYKQDEIAQVIGVCRSAYSCYETGTTHPDPMALGILADFYHLPVQVFFERGDVAEIDRKARVRRKETSLS